METKSYESNALHPNELGFGIKALHPNELGLGRIRVIQARVGQGKKLKHGQKLMYRFRDLREKGRHPPLTS